MNEGLYRLPFSADPVIHRAPAPFHRIGKNMRWCVDFAMPVGTLVLAARGGVVEQVVSEFEQNYHDMQGLHRANFIVICHPDGQISHYAHLAYKSASVQRGQSVAAGQVIARSGQTGYATYPHLHFGVFDSYYKNIRISWVRNPEIDRLLRSIKTPHL